MKIILICFLLAISLTLNTTTTNLLWPKPAYFTSDNEGLSITISPCDINYIVESPGKAYVDDIINLYLTTVFKCTKIKKGQVSINIVVKDVDQLIPTDKKHEQYSLLLRNNSKWELIAQYYPGFLRGIQTFSQLFELNSNDKYQVNGLPIDISDAPQFLWRGLMIDTSRHFLPISTIKRSLDSMLFSKLNVLHWHITDQDAFPLFVPTVPELSQSGKVGGVYSQADVNQIIAYARPRGIRVVPQIDTPAHTQSWGRSQKYKGITLNCNGKYQGQLDPTLNLTWEVVQNVLKYMNKSFSDEYVHFGGDEVVYECWGKRPSIVQWMGNNNITDYKSLSIYFRQVQKQVWRKISASKKVIYWANEAIDLPVYNDDVIQWWGVSTNVAKMEGRKNEVILSNYDLTYLDIGFGNFYGNNYGVYQSWRKMYNFQPRVKNVNVIGGESCMWNELGNKHTFEQKVIQRSSVIGERLWNDNIHIATDLRNIAARLTAHTQRLRNRGFKVWPVTVGLCEQNIQICF